VGLVEEVVIPATRSTLRWSWRRSRGAAPLSVAMTKLTSIAWRIATTIRKPMDATVRTGSLPKIKGKAPRRSWPAQAPLQRQ